MLRTGSIRPTLKSHTGYGGSRPTGSVPACEPRGSPCSSVSEIKRESISFRLQVSRFSFTRSVLPSRGRLAGRAVAAVRGWQMLEPWPPRSSMVLALGGPAAVCACLKNVAHHSRVRVPPPSLPSCLSGRVRRCERRALTAATAPSPTATTPSTKAR